MKLEINHRKINEKEKKKITTWKLRNMLLKKKKVSALK